MDAPDGIDLGRHAELEGHRSGVLVKRAAIVALAAIPALALANVFGQRPSTSLAAGTAATLELSAPAHIRAGLLYTARLTVTARSALRAATLELSPGWVEGMQVNTIEPGPLREASHDGRLRLVLGHVPAGERHVLWIAVQVDPTTVGRHPQDVRLLDGDRELATVRRTITLFP